MNARRKPLVEVTHDALAALTRGLGVADTARFLNQFSTGFGDYTKERDALFRDLTLDELFAAMDASHPRAQAKPSRRGQTARRRTPHD
jgi:hypothetical protein